MIHKIIAIPLLAVFFFMSSGSPALAAGLTDTQIQAILSLLSSFGADTTVVGNVSASLRGQAPSLPSSASPAATAATECVELRQVTRTLYEGLSDTTTDGQVSLLQRFLATDPSLYPEGRVTGYFGPATERAVERWQAKYAVVSSGTAETTGYGVVGLLTREAFAKRCGYVPNITQTYPPVTSSTSKTSYLTPDQIKVISPMATTISVGGRITITYVVGSTIVAGDPVIIERSIINVPNDSTNSGYVPLSQSAGTYSFDWIPNEPGTYQALVKINHKNTQYSARSGVITVVGSTISVSNLLTPVVTASISPSSVTVGQSALLSWSSTNANRCYLQYGSVQESISVSGTRTITPYQSSTYVISCTNDPGTGKDGPTGQKSISVSVTSVPPPVITSLSVSPTQVSPGQPAVISWTSTGASKCGILRDTFNWEVMNLGTSGSYAVYPTTSNTYILSCNGIPDGSGKDVLGVQQNVYVSVASVATAPTCVVTHTPEYASGAIDPSPVTMTWSSQNANYGVVQFKGGNSILDFPPGDTISANGSMVVYHTTPTLYRFTFNGPGGAKICDVMLGYKG